MESPTLVEALDRADGLLSRLRSWNLTEPQWEQIDTSLRALHAAVTAREVRPILLAISTLDLLGPTRGTPLLVRADAVPRLQSVPPPVMQRSDDVERAVRDARAPV